MNLHLRTEESGDFHQVAKLIQAAFRDDPHGDHQEHLLVERLRKSAAFIPELSIVALVDGEIVGHILLTKTMIRNQEQNFESLSLAPVSVIPWHQNKGVGSKLIREAHRRAKALGYTFVTVLGHEDYYPRFGYDLAKNYNITFSFEVPDENCMVLELKEGALDGVSGEVVYPAEFFDN